MIWTMTTALDPGKAVGGEVVRPSKHFESGTSGIPHGLEAGCG